MAEIIPVAQAGQYAQLGIEAAFGTEIDASVQLASVKINDGIEIESKNFKASGAKLDTVITYGKEGADLGFEGVADYEELYLFIASLAKAAATDIPSYTIEKGPIGATGMIYTGAVVTDWTLKGDTSGVDVSGTMKCKASAPGMTTGGLIQNKQNPIENKHCTVKVAGAKIENVLSWSIGASNLWAMCNFVGDKNAVGANEGDIGGDITLVMEATTSNIARVNTRTEQTFEFAFTNGVNTFNLKCNGILTGAEKFSAVGEVYAIGLIYRMTNTLVDGTNVILVSYS